MFMKLLLNCCLSLALVTGGCVTKSGSKERARAAFLEGQHQAGQQQTQAPSVSFRGDVRKPSVPWTEDLTLAQALLAAEYTGLWDPRTITLQRQGQTYRINPKRLLSGAEDPALEPGDIVEVRR